MPRVSRRRTIAAPPSEVWALVSDPYSLPRWWPRTVRVEAVGGPSDDGPSEWTKVLETGEGRGVRADFHRLSSATNERYAWGQEVEGTPFARHLKRSEVEIVLAAAGEQTAIEIRSTQTMRGLSRLGGLMLKRAQGQVLEEALSGIEQALGGERE